MLHYLFVTSLLCSRLQLSPLLFVASLYIFTFPLFHYLFVASLICSRLRLFHFSGPSIKYVTLFWTIFDPLHPVTLCHTSRDHPKVRHTLEPPKIKKS